MKKKLISTLLVFSLILSISGNTTYSKVKAMDMHQTNIITTQAPQGADSYISKAFSRHLHAALQSPSEYGFTNAEISSFTLGTPFNIYKLNNETLDDLSIYYYPILYKGKVKATIAVTKTKNGEFTSTFSKGFSNELENALENNKGKSFRIVDINGELRAVSDTDAILISKDINSNEVKTFDKNNIDKVKKLAENNLKSNKYKESNITVQPLVGSANNSTNTTIAYVDPSRPVSSAYLNVQTVYQGSHPWCWAATIASIVNYRKSTTLSAEDVVKYYYKSVVDNAPDPSAYISIYNHYGISGSYLDSYNETWTDATYRLKNGSPLDSLWWTIDNSSAHAMTVRGFESYSDGSRDYLIIDPNYGYESVDAQTNSGDCYYVLSSKTYYWEKSVKGL